MHTLMECQQLSIMHNVWSKHKTTNVLSKAVVVLQHKHTPRRGKETRRRDKQAKQVPLI